MAITEEWKVYYHSAFWKPWHDRSRSGSELKLNACLSWGDEVWHIPSVYLCGKGFVIDYCIEIQPEKVKAFIDKWNLTQHGEERISREVRRQIERDNPLAVSARSYFTLNGKAVRQKSGSSLCYIPEAYLPNGIENPEETLALIEHYKLDSAKAWSFHRISCPWATVRKPKEIKSLSLRLERNPETIEGIHFKNPSVGDVITFTHPISGAEHKLTVTGYEQQELPAEAFSGGEYELPTHHTAMEYTLEPPLSGAEFSVCDCLDNDEARHIPQDPNLPQATCAASIAVIGGADGPSSVIMFSEARDSEVFTAFSALHFEPTHDVEWKTEFCVKMMEDAEIKLI